MPLLSNIWRTLLGHNPEHSFSCAITTSIVPITICPSAIEFGSVSDWAAVGIGAVSALMTFAAVAVAIAVPAVLRYMDAVKEREIERIRAQIAAIYLGPQVLDMHVAVIFVRGAVPRLAELIAESPAAVKDMCLLAAKMPDLRDLATFGRQIAIAIAGMGATAQAWNRFIETAFEVELVPGQLHPLLAAGSHVEAMLDQLDSALKNLAHAISPLLPEPLVLNPLPEGYDVCAPLGARVS